LKPSTAHRSKPHVGAGLVPARGRPQGPPLQRNSQRFHFLIFGSGLRSPSRGEWDLARYRIEEYVRWEDIDAAGIINYQAYLRFFGLAEAELLRSAGLSYRVLTETLGIWLPRARVECDFHEPVKLDELLVVEAYFSRIGRTSVHLEFEVRRKAAPSRPTATGKYVLVCVRQRDFTPVPVPEELRRKISPFVEAESATPPSWPKRPPLE